MKRLILPAALLAFGIALVSCSSDASTTTEADNALRVQTEEGQIDGFFDFSTGSEKSFGLFTCSNLEAVTLESIDAVNTEGEIEFLGAVVMRASDGFIGAVDGYPPAGLAADATEAFDDYVVDVSCDDENAETKVQIVLGAGRTGSGGGQIEGIRIEHSEGYLVIDDYRIVLCGDDYEYCEALRPEA